ncbi:MAG TPA: M56 family metallopeptidase [Roseiarcus sp.]|nr:M56 family metallopeptidase [Roseiarcus sp.]
MIATLLDAALRSIVLAVAVWLVLRLLRLRNPHLELMAWTIVLAASLLMPATTRLAAIAVPPAPVAALGDLIPAPSQSSSLRPAEGGFLNVPDVSPTTDSELPAPPAPAPASGFDPRLVASAIYLAVAGVFLARMVAGLLLTLRLVRAAEPLRKSRNPKYDIRVSRDLSAPATFGSIVLLPQDYADWSEAKRLAVLAHETAHARRGDFYIQIAAAVNRAIFWFNPLSWWLQRRLSQLAEAVSDDAALAYIKDRPLYAEILLELSRGAPIGYGAVAMARPATVRARIERILAETSAPLAIGGRARAAFIVAMLPLAAIAASPLAARPSPQENGAIREAAVRAPMAFVPAVRAADASPPIESEERTALPPTDENVTEVARPQTSVDVKARNAPDATKAAPGARTTATLANPPTQPNEIDARETESASALANAASNDRPVAQGGEEANPVIQSGGDRHSVAAEAATLARFVTTAPKLRQRNKDRTAPQIDGKRQRLPDGKGDSLSTDVSLTATQETGAPPDICPQADLQIDPKGQRALFRCGQRKSASVNVLSAEMQVTGAAPDCSQGDMQIDPKGQRALFRCRERKSASVNVSSAATPAPSDAADLCVDRSWWHFDDASYQRAFLLCRKFYFSR